jgi:lysophospholipase L1-like esterase
VARAPVPPAGGGAAAPTPPLNFNNQSIRQVVHVSAGGRRVRVVLSNVFGTAPLAVGAAHVALREKDAGIVAGSGRALTFGGRPTASVPAGATLVSDPVALTVPDFADLAIDVHLPGDTGAGSSPLTVHNGALQTNYVSQPGNHVGTAVFPVASTTAAWFFLARVEVEPTGPAASVVAFGDSLTDGTASTPNTNNRWPDHLARRLLAGRGVRLGMLNLGIAGNRLLTDGAGVNALARFDRDVLSQTGVSHVVVLEGINDLGLGRPVPPPVEDLIAAHQQLITRARARGLRIYGATMLPFEGTTFPGYWSPENEARRQAFNQWLRTSGAYDAVIDFDTVVRDAAEPTKLAGKFKAADNLHLNDAGYQALAGAVDLALFATHPETAARSR